MYIATIGTDCRKNISQIQAIGIPFIFTNRRRDNDDGLYYYLARHYNWKLRCFIQQEPIGLEGEFKCPC